MEIDENLIKKVAQNARLELSEDEIREFVPQLKEVLESFSSIDEIETEDVSPSFQPVDIRNTVRKDEAGKCLSQEEALKNAHHKKEGYFKGPRVV